jgi:hypothetical protein
MSKKLRQSVTLLIMEIALGHDGVVDGRLGSCYISGAAEPGEARQGSIC